MTDMYFDHQGNYFPENQMPSNQQETLQKLNAYQNWASMMPQQQGQQQGGIWGAIGKIADAYGKRQWLDNQANAQAPTAGNMQVGEGVPTILEALMKNMGGV